MGFSWLGLLVSLGILAPSFLLMLFPPTEALPTPRISPVFTATEKVGQAGCLAIPVLSERGFAEPGSTVALTLMLASIAAYYGLWARYLFRGRHPLTLYGPLWRIPVPMAVFPVLAFGFAALWIGSWWLAVATVILAAGHWTVSGKIFSALIAENPPPRA